MSAPMDEKRARHVLRAVIHTDGRTLAHRDTGKLVWDREIKRIYLLGSYELEFVQALLWWIAHEDTMTCCKAMREALDNEDIVCAYTSDKTPQIYGRPRRSADDDMTDQLGISFCPFCGK